MIVTNVKRDTYLMTDRAKFYVRLGHEYRQHGSVDHGAHDAIVNSPVRPIGCQPILLPALLPVLLLPFAPEQWSLGWSALGCLALTFLWIGFVCWRAYVIADTPKREARRKPNGP